MVGRNYFWPLLLKTDVKMRGASDKLPPHTLVEGLVDFSWRNLYSWRARLAVFSSLRSENVEKSRAQQNFGGSDAFLCPLPRGRSTCHLHHPPHFFALVSLPLDEFDEKACPSMNT
jgi:hypothetical protein